MNYDFEDYRKPRPEPPGWVEWRVPPPLGLDYIFKIILFLIGIPFVLFGSIYTPIGFLINLIIVDYFIYIGYKARGLL